MSITEFVTLCDRYCADTGASRTWLSKRLFNDTYRIQSLADGKSDVGVNRLARAAADLTALRVANDLQSKAEAA